jgi:hypothetical protein
MGLINNIKDAFNKAEFTVAPNKKLKTLSADFLKAFDLQLAFYKGQKALAIHVGKSVRRKVSDNTIEKWGY